jgi:hypothetical protein
MTKEQLARARQYFKRSRSLRSKRQDAWMQANYGRKYNATDCALEAFELLERIWHGCLSFDGGAANCAEDILEDMEALFK